MANFVSAPPPSTKVGYDVARTMIKDGDMISFFASHEDTWLHRITTVAILYFCGSRIYHSGIALWMTTDHGEKRLMLCEAVGVGRRLVNMSHFADHKMEVTAKPDTVDTAKVEAYMLDGIGTPYAFGDLAKIAIMEFFGKKTVTTSTTGAVCSETAARAWEAGGMTFDTTALSPGMLRNVLFAKGIPPTFMINPDAGN